MERQEHNILPAYDAMVFPILCVLLLFVINREGQITRNEAYTMGLCLIWLYLPLTWHSLELAEKGLTLRHSIIPRRQHFAWGELSEIRYRLHSTGERAGICLCPRQGRRKRISVNLQKEGAAESFGAFLEQARQHLGAEHVVEKPTPFWHLFM